MIGRVLGWLARLSRDEDPTIHQLIVPPVLKFSGFDPDLRERTLKRRQAADGIRNRANAVDTGAKTPDLLRRIK